MLRSVGVRALCVLTVFSAASLSVAAATIEIASPTDYQVFQRHNRVHGVVRIAGKLDSPRRIGRSICRLALSSKAGG